MDIDNKYLQGLVSQIDDMLMPDEKSLCPVYCVFRSNNFLARPSSICPGIITVTDRNRVLTARQIFSPRPAEVYDLTTITKLKITNMPLKQKVLNMVFLENGKKVRLKLQAAGKVIGNSLPGQADNLEHLIVLLSRHGA